MKFLFTLSACLLLSSTVFAQQFVSCTVGENVLDVSKPVQNYTVKFDETNPDQGDEVHFVAADHNYTLEVTLFRNADSLYPVGFHMSLTHNESYSTQSRSCLSPNKDDSYCDTGILWFKDFKDNSALSGGCILFY